MPEFDEVYKIICDDETEGQAQQHRCRISHREGYEDLLTSGVVFKDPDSVKQAAHHRTVAKYGIKPQGDGRCYTESKPAYVYPRLICEPR